MATLTSTHRPFSSTSLTAAPTQNTAPVHEFRCLYTRDLYKKSKKWHDGSLRFHTFNRRVMVYDDAKNYIADLHYTKEDEFGEGLELQLDRGVLVEVGERLGETETDLAPILDRPRSEKAQSPRRPPVSLGSRPQSTGLSQRPKSLLEVLGPSQRRRVQYKSPYEQRHGFAQDASAEPPEKRHKTSSDKENSSNGTRQPVPRSGPGLPQPLQPSKPVSQLNRRREPPIEAENFLDLSSDEDPKRSLSTVARLTTKPAQNVKEVSEKHRLTSGFSHPKPTKPATSKGREGQPGQDRNTAIGKQPSPSHSSRKRATKAPPASIRPLTARLRLSEPKPRLKLTCILPFTPARRAEDSPAESAIPVPSSQSSTHEHENTGNDNSSPLFVPEEVPRSLPPSPAPLATQDEFPFTDSINHDVFESVDRTDLPQPPLSPPAVTPQDLLGTTSVISEQNETNATFEPDSPPEPEEACALETERPPAPVSDVPIHNDSPKPESHPANHSAVPENPVLGDAQPTSLARSFRRFLSENDAGDAEDLTLEANTVAANARSPLQLLENLSTRRTPAKLKSPSKIQRCSSDTLALEKRHTTKSVQGSSGSSGPWTVDEAFLLFEWWPAEIEKPLYWTDNLPEPVSRALPELEQGFRGGITTARQFLRDDVNVL